MSQELARLLHELEVIILHTFREANTTADALANLDKDNIFDDVICSQRRLKVAIF